MSKGPLPSSHPVAHPISGAQRDDDLGRTYTLTWPTTQLHAGRPVTDYRITRTSTLGGAVLGNGTCTGITVLRLSSPAYVPADISTATQSCTDISAIDLGVVRYTITPIYGRWIGPTSTWSLSIS